MNANFSFFNIVSASLLPIIVFGWFNPNFCEICSNTKHDNNRDDNQMYGSRNTKKQLKKDLKYVAHALPTFDIKTDPDFFVIKNEMKTQTQTHMHAQVEFESKSTQVQDIDNNNDGKWNVYTRWVVEKLYSYQTKGIPPPNAIYIGHNHKELKPRPEFPPKFSQLTDPICFQVDLAVNILNTIHNGNNEKNINNNNNNINISNVDSDDDDEKEKEIEIEKENNNDDAFLVIQVLIGIYQ